MDVTRMTALGRDLRTRLRTFFDAPLGHDATPLEIAQAVLDEVDRRVQPIGRGRRVFPYSAMQVRVLASDGAAPAVEACFDGFAARVRERLAEVMCEMPAALDVRLTCLAVAPPGWADDRVFDVAFTRQEPPAAPAAALTASDRVAPPPLSVTVLKGESVTPTCTFSERVVSIGRSADATDGFGRVRRNRIAFADVVDGVTETVGRAHARLRFDPTCGDYRLYDEGSSNGTAILREGEVIPVARHDPRGVRVRSGDEIQVGRALLRVEIGAQPGLRQR